MYRGVEQSGQLGWLITIRSQVRILPPQPRNNPELFVRDFFLVRCQNSVLRLFALAKIVAGSAHRVERKKARSIFFRERVEE